MTQRPPAGLSTWSTEVTDVKALIEKLGLAIHGEQPSVVVEVLAMFTIGCLELAGVPLDEYVAKLRDASQPPPAVSRTKSN